MYSQPMRWLVLPILLTGCGMEPTCSSEVKEKTYDREGGYYATTEVRDCGATADYATVVRVGRMSESKDQAQEVFIADSDHGQATSVGGGLIWTSVGWPKPGQLSVSYATNARVFKKLETAKQAAITYRATEPYSLPLVP
jgi:hypothetical protein